MSRAHATFWELEFYNTVVFRFKHVQLMQDFWFNQDFTFPKMKE